MLIISSFLVFLILENGAVIAAGEEQSDKFFYQCTAEGWTNNGDTCYHVLNKKAKWHGVQKLCRNLGATFAYLDDKNDMKALAEAATIRSAPTVWVKGSNANDQKVFAWHDAARTPIDSNMTPWIEGFPEDKATQFVYMKIDLDTKKFAGLAHSSGAVERPVACMMPARKILEENYPPYWSQINYAESSPRKMNVLRGKSRINLDLTQPRRRKTHLHTVVSDEQNEQIKSRYDSPETAEDQEPAVDDTIEKTNSGCAKCSYEAFYFLAFMFFQAIEIMTIF